MRPMLAGSIPLSDIDEYLHDDRFVAQQKLDGDRTMIRVQDGQVLVLNRDGELRTNPFPQRIVREFRAIQRGDWCFDGELLDGELWLFDLPLAGRTVQPTHSYEFRSRVLGQIVGRWRPGPSVRLLPTAATTPGKARLLEAVLGQQGEGVIFKSVDAVYRPGRRSTQMLKAKFEKTVDCVVTAVRRDGKDNCHLIVFDNGQPVEVGSVAMAGKAPVAVGDVIEVKYLYASDTNKLVQTAFLRVRYDKAATECTLDQLVYTDRTVVLLDGCYARYLRQCRRSRSTGTEVAVFDTHHPDSEYTDNGGRWLTRCEHGSAVNHPSLRLAQQRAPHPDLWCLQCRLSRAKAAA